MNSRDGQLLSALPEDAPPEQGGERTDVGQVGTGVDTDENGEYRPGTGGGHRREEKENRREIVDEIGEHGSDGRDQQERAE